MFRAQRVHAWRLRSGDTCNLETAAGAGAVRLQCIGFSDRRGAGKRPKKGAVSGAEVPRIRAIQFSSYCHSFPLFALLTAGDKATDTGQKPGP